MNNNMKTISFRMTKKEIEQLNNYAKESRYFNESEVIRSAIKFFIKNVSQEDFKKLGIEDMVDKKMKNLI